MLLSNRIRLARGCDVAVTSSVARKSIYFPRTVTNETGRIGHDVATARRELIN
ncbi:hypothetical protein [Haloechinothrix halophila]|uniref:hypothetical protein n=1 Tax=Haloechinothrix halophila TaxID=1069073 RepID=UPI000423325F|nr:hypothetical protein [Haloechinothrix halophila]